MPSRRPLSFALLGLALGVAAGACSDADEAGAPVICGDAERAVLVEEKLTRGVPSTPFALDPDEELWLSVVADADFNPSALFPSVATLYLIDADAEPQIREDANGLPIIDDPATTFESEGEWRRATTVPGSYQVWSRRGPVIEVAACPTGVGGD